MPEYMAYAIGPDGHLIAVKALDCADDIEAAGKMQGLVGGRDIELWCGDRFVIRFEPDPE